MDFRLSLIRFLLLPLFLSVSLICAARQAWAQKEGSAIPPSKDSVDAVLLLDASGSMLMTDPGRLRDEGAKLLAQLLRPGDRLAIIEFSDRAKILRPLTEFQNGQVDQISYLVSQIKNDGTFTDLAAPIDLAKLMLEGQARPDADQVIILLSDGKMDPDPAKSDGAAATAKLLTQLLPALRNKGIKVHTLSLSEEADRDLLSQIAVLTNGVHWYTPDADKIHESFADLFLVVKRPQMLPLTSKGFRIDAEIEEATFYINREDDSEVSLTSPEGDKINKQNAGGDIKWYSGRNFDVVTIIHPAAGQWHVDGLPQNEGFVAVLTNLKLLTNWPSVLISGVPTPLEVRLFESKKPIVLPKMTGVVEYRYKITPTDRISEPIIKDFLFDEGEDGDKVAGDGVFSSMLTIDPPGEYKLKVLASGPTFERYQQLSFRVKPRLIKLEVVSAEDSLLGRYDRGKVSSPSLKSKEYFRITLSPELRGTKNLEVKLEAFDKDRNQYTLPLHKIDEVREVGVRVLPKEGEYTLQASFTGEGKHRKSLRGDSRKLVYLKLPDEEGAKDVMITVKSDEQPLPAPKESNLGWLYGLLLVTCLNGGAGILAIRFLKRAQTASAGGDFDEEKFEPVDEAVAAIMALEQKVELTEIDLEDPIFSEAAPDGMPVRKPSAVVATGLTRNPDKQEGSAGSREEADSEDFESEEAGDEQEAEQDE